MSEVADALINFCQTHVVCGIKRICSDFLITLEVKEEYKLDDLSKVGAWVLLGRDKIGLKERKIYD